MLELIFAWIGAGVSVVFVLSVFSWLWIVYNKKRSIRYHEVRDAKLKEYDELAREINRQSNILMRDDWDEWSWSGYDFKKLTKELIELRKFKEEYLKNKESEDSE